MKKIATVATASIGAFAVGATAAGGIAIASANSNNAPATANSNQQGWGPGPGGMKGDRGRGETLTGEEAQKAMDAALAAVPGTADHAHKAPDGTYRVMVTTSDAKQIVVMLDADLAVTDQREMTGRGPGRGPGTPATAEETQKATAAAQARIPGATVIQVFKRADDGYAVMLRKDNGRKRIVMLDANYAVQSVESPRRHRGHHGRTGEDVVGPAFKKAEAAALTKFSKGTVLGVHKVGKRYVAAVKKADGSLVMVRMNSSFKVTGTREMDFRRGPAPAPSASSSTAA